jgi:hypothetical protein
VEELFVYFVYFFSLSQWEVQMQVSDVVEPLLAETMQESYKGIELESADEFGGEEGAEAGEGSIQAVPVEDHVHYYIVSEGSLSIGYNSI